jgi:hypothetical protein
MTEQHPITPPPELVEQWINEEIHSKGFFAAEDTIATRAAQWGADQELKACCDAIYLLEDQPLSGGTAEWLRTTRRPKPLSQKEQALSEVAAAVAAGEISPERGSIIRLALEQLDD